MLTIEVIGVFLENSWYGLNKAIFKQRNRRMDIPHIFLVGIIKTVLCCCFTEKGKVVLYHFISWLWNAIQCDHNYFLIVLPEQNCD